MNLHDAVRIEAGDNDTDHGIMPGKKQVPTKVIEYAASAESVTSYDTPTQREIWRVAARVLEIAAAAWASQPIEEELGPHAEVNKTFVNLRNRALELRRKSEVSISNQGQAPNYSSNGLYVLPPGVN